MRSRVIRFLSAQLWAVCFSLFFTLILYGGVGSGWQIAAGYRWKDLPTPAKAKAGFTLLPPETTGILFPNFLSDAPAARNRVLQSGSGVALGDVDGQVGCAIYFCCQEVSNVLDRHRGVGS